MKLLIILVAFCLLATTMQAQDYTISNNEIKISLPIVFETLQDKLKPESDTAIKLIARILNDKKYISTLRVEGHGNDVASQTLTEKRAITICQALVSKGIDCNRLFGCRLW